MYIVKRLPFTSDDSEKTKVWISEQAKKGLLRLKKKGGGGYFHFIKKLKECSISGFDNHFGGVLRPEGNKVYRFGIDSSLFRLAGFFSAKEFIFLESYVKPGKQMSKTNKNCIKNVADALSTGDWKKSLG